MKRAAGIVTCGVFLAIPFSAVMGQSVPSMQKGQWVRISTKFEGAEPDWLLAQVSDLTPAYLVVDPLASDRLAIMRESLTQLQVFQGWVSKQEEGTLIGGAVGMVSSIVLSFTTECSVYCLAGIPLGAVVGRVLGGTVAHIEWLPLQLDKLDAAFAPRRVARVRLGATVAF
jgi:hypothetical protein